MMEEIASTLQGTWVLERSENVNKYLTELGVGDCERRKFADDNFTQTIIVCDDTIVLEMNFGPRHFQQAFKLNEEFEIRAGKTSKAVARWSNGALVVEARRVECSRLQVIERRLVGDRLVQTMTSNGVTCKRIMKKIDAANSDT